MMAPQPGQNCALLTSKSAPRLTSPLNRPEGNAQARCLVQHCLEERACILRPDVHPVHSAEAVLLQIPGPFGRVNLSGVRLPEPLKLRTEYAAGLEAGRPSRA